MKTYKKIVLNIPHSSGDVITTNDWFNWDKGINEKMSKQTDWHTDTLFKPLATNLDGKVTEVVFPYNRFFCDVERLINDEMESIGQGIYYTNFEGCKRVINEDEKDYVYKLREEHLDKLKKEIDSEEVIVIDCHSFPSEKSEDIDICIGFNDDWSYPGEEVIEKVKDIFKGCRIGINNPYSNSITPEKNFHYHSFMIEINKNLYLNEDNTMKVDAYKLTMKINKVYQSLLLV